MKKSLSLLTAGGLALGLSAPTQAEELGAGWSLSSNVAITSNYVFRGISESDEDPAVQGGFDLGHESGAYVGTWASSLRYDEPADSQPAAELDAYGGYEFALTADAWADIGLTYYGYPNASDSNTTELYAGVGTSLGEVEGDLYIHGSDDYFGTDESSAYTETNWTVPFGTAFYGSAHLGYLAIDSDTDMDGADAAVGVGYDHGSLDLSLVASYLDSDAAEDDDDESQVTFTLAREF
ncbi:MAG: TorF family putative porin [Halorhodospira sp.]